MKNSSLRNQLFFIEKCSLFFPCVVLRRTRLPSTLRPAWEKQRLSSCFCNTWPILMLPPPTATPRSTYPPERGRWRRPLCCWRPGLHIHWPPRWAEDPSICVNIPLKQCLEVDTLMICVGKVFYFLPLPRLFTHSCKLSIISTVERFEPQQK